MRECIEIRLNLKLGANNTLCNVRIGLRTTSPTSNTLTLYPFGKVTKKG